MYGDVLVLAASAGVSVAAIRSGEAVLILAATIASTYLAHVLADVVGAAFAGAGFRHALVAELRDAMPILSAGIPSTVLLGAAAAGWLAAALARDVASAILLARIAAVGLVYRHFHHEATILRSVLFGLAAAGIAAASVAIKLIVGH